MSLELLLGIAGSGLVVLAFVMLELGRWSRTDRLYDAANAIGSGLLIWYSVLLESWPFVLLNLVWLAASLKDIVWRR